MKRQRHRPLVRGLVGLVVFVALAAGLRPAEAVTPDDPRVREAIDRGLKFLESGNGAESRLGGKALVGLALLKHGDDNANHPRIIEAVTAIQNATRNNNLAEVESNFAYSAGLSIIFLVTLDPSKYRIEIEALQEWYLKTQKGHGGWGYLSGGHADTGDTSMTQYAVLSAWEAAQVGLPMPADSVNRVALWLLKTQDRSGGYGYQGKPSGGLVPIEQSGVRSSLSAAGLGSVYISADLLGVTEPVKPRDDALPPALEEVEEREFDGARRKTQIDPRWFRAVQDRGNAWMARNYKIDPAGWTNYSLYAWERYHSFREAAEGRVEKEPAWYSQGAEYLLRTQAADGSWDTKSGKAPDTAFALLFLMRSTKKSIEKARDYGSGTLVGGRGLPKETTKVKVRQGKVVSEASLRWSDQLLDALENPDAPNYDDVVAALADASAGDMEAMGDGYATRLRKLAGGEEPEARIAAISVLARKRDLDNVPIMIYALTDPDSRVVGVARDGLRLISRKFDGFELPDSPTPAQVEAAVESWKGWYLEIRPDAEFEE